MNAVPHTPAPSEDEIAAFLQDQTTWRGGPTELWREALDQVAAEPPAAVRPPSPLPWVRRLAPLALAACLVVAAIAALLPSLGKARSSMRRVPESASSARAFSSLQAGAPSSDRATPLDEKRAGEIDYQRVDDASLADRQVIRKATIELAAKDVRTAFSKAQLLLRAEIGEYAEGSSFTGDGDTARAQITLRVAADRLGAVLNQLRELGKVVQENSSGDDVTAQAVDLDARLRNERKVETELLQLLESRKDAPLKEILDLRQSLSSVREQIERLQGQRDTLSRQVSLATILLILHADATPEPEKPAGASAFFDDAGKSLTSALRGGAKTLIASLSFLLELAIGGAFFWAILGIVALMVRRHLVNRPKVSIGPDPALR